MRMYARNKTATIIGGIVIGIITLGALFCLGAVIYGSCTNQSFPQVMELIGNGIKGVFHK